MNNRPVILPTIVATPLVTIEICPRCGGAASITVINGPDSDGDQATVYNGSDEGLLIAFFKEAKEKYPDAVVRWSGWEDWSERDFNNHVARNLCLRVDAEYVDVYGITLPVRRLIIR